MPKIVLNRLGIRKRTVQSVYPDDAGGTVDEVPRVPIAIVCETGGEHPPLARLMLRGIDFRQPRVLDDLDPATLRRFATAFSVAADVLDGLARSPELERELAERAVRAKALAQERAALELRLAQEGVTLACTGCGDERRVLPEFVAAWLEQRPQACCPRRNRRYQVVRQAAVAN